MFTDLIQEESQAAPGTGSPKRSNVSIQEIHLQEKKNKKTKQNTKIKKIKKKTGKYT